MSMRIGIVEDNPQIAEMLRDGLKLSGNEVTVYTNAQDCIAAVLGARFNNIVLPHDILVTDLDLGSGIDGAEMLRRLRQFISPAELPCIIMSGRDLIEMNLMSQNLFDVPLMQKPLTPLSLLKEIKKVAGAGKR